MNAQQLKTWEAEVGYLQEKIQQQQFEIEALKEAHDLSLDGRDFATRQIILDVIANLEKEALAQPEQYPQIAINPEIVGYVAPQRTWVELTDEEIEELANEYLFAEGDLGMLFVGGSVEFARAILRKAKEKNS